MCTPAVRTSCCFGFSGGAQRGAAWRGTSNSQHAVALVLSASWPPWLWLSFHFSPVFSVSWPWAGSCLRGGLGQPYIRARFPQYLWVLDSTSKITPLMHILTFIIYWGWEERTELKPFYSRMKCKWFISRLHYSITFWQHMWILKNYTFTQTKQKYAETADCLEPGFSFDWHYLSPGNFPKPYSILI